MTDQTPDTAPETDPQEQQEDRLTPQKAGDILARLEENQRKSREQATQIEAAWRSGEVAKIREIVREDGNVDWVEFVKHCGGILNVVAMVDDYGLPDTDQIIPKVDELFKKWAQIEVDSGSVFRRHPGNRPYIAARGTSAGEARAADKRARQSQGENEADRFQRQEREQQQAAAASTGHLSRYR